MIGSGSALLLHAPEGDDLEIVAWAPAPDRCGGEDGLVATIMIFGVVKADAAGDAQCLGDRKLGVHLHARPAEGADA